MSHIQREKEPLLGPKAPQKPPSLMFWYLTVFISSLSFTVVLPSLFFYLDNEVWRFSLTFFGG
jgi:hypothetical protein